MHKRLRCALLLLLSLLIAENAFCRNESAAAEFRDPTPAEKAMTSVGFAPGAAAVILNWHQVVVDDKNSYRTDYFRIKILTEEGKKYGDAEVPHIALLYDVNHIKARTVRPDGSIATFDGKTFDKVVVKVGGVRLISKTFTLPDVQVGSIIEYRYDIANRGNLIYDTSFSPQRELPIIHEEISLEPYAYGGYNTFFSYRGLPAGKKPEIHGSKYGMTLENIPPFEEEPFAPPEATIKPELQFWYTAGTTEPDVFWTKEAHDWADAIEPFVGDGRAVKDAATAAMAGAATPEEKLRKLYARVQEIRNLSFEPERTDAETRKLKDNNSAQDVLRNGYGGIRDINRLFVSMARAAGFDAHVIRLCERDEQYIAKNVPIGRQLDGEIAAVTIDGKHQFFDPGTPYAPFGVLSWQKTSTTGLLIARKQEKAVWIDTPWPHSDAATMSRSATLRLTSCRMSFGVLRCRRTKIKERKMRKTLSGVVCGIALTASSFAAAPAAAPSPEVAISRRAERIYSVMSAVSVADRKAVFRGLSPSMKAEVWHAHFRAFSAAHALSPAQAAIVAAARDLFSEDLYAISTADPAWESQVHAPLQMLEQSARNVSLQNCYRQRLASSDRLRPKAPQQYQAFPLLTSGAA